MAKKKKNIFKSVTNSLLYLTIAAFCIYFITQYFNKPHFVRYPEFGIPIPINYSIHGIDVSHHQDNIDWDEVKNMQVKNIKIGFAFIKATEGTDIIDNNFRLNWVDAKKANVPIGAYHFFIASKSGKDQAENFIQSVSLTKGDLPPVLDIEQTNGATVKQLQQNAKQFLDIVETEFGVKPIIYCNIDFYENYLVDEFEDYPIWIAHYMAQNKPRIKRNWLFWQHNENGRVNGIDEPVDFNVFYGDSTDFKNLLIK